MIFWKIRYDGNKIGYQVMDSTMSNAYLIDENCQRLEGAFDYEFVEVSEAPACWVQ